MIDAKCLSVGVPTLKAEAAKLNIEIERGSTFDETFIWKDKDLTPIPLVGYTAEMHVRETLDSVGTIDDLSTANGRLVLDTPVGGIRIIISAAISTTQYLNKTYVYDFELTLPSGNVRRLFEGNILSIGEVTR